jgi:hypothetical protein
MNTLDINALQDGDIIYTQGFERYKRELLNIIKDTKKVILISHNCDQCIDDSYDIPDNVIKWYSVNVDTDNPKVESIPLGLQNDIWYEGKIIPNVVQKLDRMRKKLQEPKNMKNLVYIDHRLYSNPTERIIPYNVLEGKPWVTAVKTYMDSKDTMDKVPYIAYLDNIYNHKFIVCAMGNGIDTHRPWEALYMGSIPLMRKHVNYSFYKDLPICLVDEWEQVDEYFLTNWLIENHGRKWNMDMLNFSYWRNKICKS